MVGQNSNQRLVSKKRATRKGSKTPPEVQARIIGMLLTGQFRTDEELSQAVGVSKSTVSRLRSAIPAAYLKQAETLKKETISLLVADFLTASLESLIRIDQVTVSEDWLRAQDAASLATFYGVKSDKVFRILEAIERAQDAKGGHSD
jgi:hypothetical protein